MLSYGRTGWWTGYFGGWYAAFVIAVLALFAQSFWLLFAAIAVAVLGFDMKERGTGRYKCYRCSGEMYDSKSIVKMMSADKAKTIGRLLESGTPSANKRQCPGCEAVMVRIPIDYVEPDSHHHHSPNDALGFVIAVVVVVAAMIPDPTKHLDLEGCPTCGMFWFDSKELAKIKESASMKGGS